MFPSGLIAKTNSGAVTNTHYAAKDAVYLHIPCLTCCRNQELASRAENGERKFSW